MASSKKLSAVDAIIAEAADLIALEQIAALNTAHLSSDSPLPSNLDARFRKLKSFPAVSATTTPATPNTNTFLRTHSAPPPTHPTPPSASKTQQQQQQEEKEEILTPVRDSDEQEEAPENRRRRRPSSSSSPPPTAAAATRLSNNIQGSRKILEPRDQELFGSAGTLRERNRERDSPSPPRQACCFGFSPKKALHRTPSKSKGTHGRGGGGGDLDLLGIGDVEEWGDENRRMAAELKEQQRKLKKALKEQEKVSMETAKMARWVKQASARMTHTAAIDDLLSEPDDDDELRS